MTLNLAWIQAQGPLGSLTFDIDEERPTLQQLRLASIAALRELRVTVDGMTDPDCFEDVVVLPLEAGISLQTLQTACNNQREYIMSTAARYAESLDQALTLEDYGNLLDIHILAVVVKPKAPVLCATSPELEFRNTNDSTTSPQPDEEPSHESAAIPCRRASAGCLRCQANGIKVKHAHPSTCPAAPTCNLCHHKGHYSGMCGGVGNLALCPQTPSGSQAEPHNSKCARTPASTSPIASTSTAADAPGTYSHPFPDRSEVEGEWSFQDMSMYSVSPLDTISPAATSHSEASGPYEAATLTNALAEDSSASVCTTAYQNLDTDSTHIPKAVRRKTKVQKTADAKLRKTTVRERMKRRDPHRLVELRPQMVFPKILTDGYDGTIGLYDGVIAWAKMPGFPWWPAEVMCFEEGGIVPLEAKEVTVMFFEADGQRTQADVPRHTLLQLGMNEEFDELMLNSQKAVTCSQSKRVRARQRGLYKAYEWAREAEADDSDDSDVSQ